MPRTACLWIVLMLLAALIGPWLSPYSFHGQNLREANRPPSLKHLLGTDHLGRDLATRILYGARLSLGIAIFSTLINLTIGIIYGAAAGYWGGWIDRLLMGFVEILYALPPLLYIILLMVWRGPGFTNVLFAIGLTCWLQMARVVRGQIMALKERDFILAAKVIGLGWWPILWRHLLPNCTGPIIVTAVLNIPLAIYLEAFLSFIGLGVAPPQASWGVLVADGLSGLRSYPWQLIFPALAMSLTILAFNRLAQYLRDYFHPRSGQYYQPRREC
ncbi:MAG: ABC transporter permease [Limnochordia bacterium]